MRIRVVADEIASAVRVLSRHHLAAIVLWDPAAAIAGGVILDARVTRELIVAIFTPDRLNRLHVGAVVIRGSRAERAAVPLAWVNVVQRAADVAVGGAISVDEDTGRIRWVNRTGRVRIVDADRLEEVLRQHSW